MWRRTRKSSRIIHRIAASPNDCIAAPSNRGIDEIAASLNLRITASPHHRITASPHHRITASR
ncbi:hypothetical protein AB0D71_18670, partial [Streptomyces avermitilis]|uniref:hypothetical protein n=1 Tax=Streptomyces avermitilis TaxID=33903 RepID=UPI0033DACBD6